MSNRNSKNVSGLFSGRDRKISNGLGDVFHLISIGLEKRFVMVGRKTFREHLIILE